MRKTTIFLLALAGLLVAGVVARTADAKVSDQDVEKMKKAMPAKAPATPAQARKVLIYSHCNGFVHGPAIEAAKVALPILGEKTGAFTAVVSDDLSNFEAEKLKEFDVVILNNTTGELLKAKAPRKPRKPNAQRIKDAARLAAEMEKYNKALAAWEAAAKRAAAQPDRSEQLRKNLMDWIKAGGGIVGIHAATDCSYQWKEYGAMIGGYFAGHPWHTLVPIKNDDPSNPINAAFGGKAFEVTDEIYMFNRGVYSREKQRVLLSLDYAKMQASDNPRLKKQGARKDGDYAVSWVKTHGKGKVFYCSLGHRAEIFWNPTVLAHYLAGIQWACGDLKGVETAPNPLK